MNKLNFGCGKRFANGWLNIDFHSEHSEVRRVNLLGPWPFPDDHFDFVYSSHTLEHFSPPTAETILRECKRIMKRGAVIRTVVPDLEKTCREYLRVLDLANTSEWARRQYDWIIIELLDQLTRSKPSGCMADFCARLQADQDLEMMNYVKSRTDTNPWPSGKPEPLTSKLRKLSMSRVKNKIIYSYIAMVKKLFPPSLREAIVDNTRIGEKHKWMYDRHNMGMLMERCGFCTIGFVTANSSLIPGLSDDFLDVNPDGSIYKPQSLYCEARKS
jgi:SAM-dependent methyltransferase